MADSILANLVTQIVQETVINTIHEYRDGSLTQEEAQQSVQTAIVQLLALFNNVESFHRVQAFHFHGRASMHGGLFNDDEIDLRVRLIDEEFKELKKGIKAWRTSEGMSGKVDALVEIADALADLDYVINGAMVSFGLPGVAIEQEVHRSNMSKFLPNGEPIKRDDGKIMKGPDYLPPDIARVLVVANILEVTEDEDGEVIELTLHPAFYPKEDDASTDSA